MHAWIAGATGLVGRALVAQLLAHPEVGRVTTLVRKKTEEHHEKLEERVLNFERFEAELAATATATATSAPASKPTHVFCCLGTTMAKAGSQEAFRRVDHELPYALAKFGARIGVEAFLIVTALGADPNSSIFYNRVKGELEADLRRLDLAKLRIFRPSLLLGDRPERRTGEDIGAFFARPLAGLMVGPLRKYRPVRAETVARAMVRIALDPGDQSVRVYPSNAIAEFGSEARKSS